MINKITKNALAIIFFYSLFFSIVSCGNKQSSNENEINQTINETIKDAVPDYTVGEGLYTKHCSGCHQNNGEGISGAFPSLKGEAVELNSIVNGIEGSVMIAYKGKLSDDDIAEIANFINHSWGNNFSEVSADDVKAMK